MCLLTGMLRSCLSLKSRRYNLGVTRLNGKPDSADTMARQLLSRMIAVFGEPPWAERVCLAALSCQAPWNEVLLESLIDVGIRCQLSAVPSEACLRPCC